MKPNGIKIKKIRKTKINNYHIVKLEIDLKHINYGLDENREYRKRKRSNFTVNDVADFFSSLNGLELEFDSDDLYDYFVVDKNYFSDNQKYRIVFCIERDKPTASGIITLFNIKKED
ncbi:hypothetical protein N9O57_01545 [bacterium]|nr:hypothetical protein [bacterium]